MKHYLIIFPIVLLLLNISCRKQTEESIPEIDPFIYKSGSLQKGETLANALIDRDIENGKVYQAVNILDKIYNLRRSHPGDSFTVKVDTLGIIHELIYKPDQQHIYRVMRDSLDQFYTKIDTISFKKVIQICEGEIESSLYQSIINQGEGGALPVMFTQIFQWDIDFFIDPQRGDRFKLLYEQYMDGDRFVRYGNILAANYSSKNFNKTAYWYTNNEGITKYYDDQGICFQKAFLKSPLNYKRISSYFGNRIHPVTQKISFHSGVDYAAAYGTPVEAVADGTVIKASWSSNHTGNTVLIRHTNGYKTLYGHLSKYGKFKVGDRVEQHDIVGYVGSTGRSTGNHLHYTIYHHDKPINPLQLKNVSGPPVPKTELADFKIYADSLNNLLFQSELSITDTLVTQDVIVEQTEDQKQETIISKTLIKIFLLLVIILIIFRIFMLLKKTNQNKGWS